MKRHIVTVALVLAASPALALEIGPPFEQTELDRQLPNIEFAPVEPYVPDSRAPYEQLTVDRTLPDLPTPSRQMAQSRGGTQTDAAPDTEAPGVSPWANDFHFIAPPL
jgi:hypothetical protein